MSRIQNPNVDLTKIKATYFEAQRKGDASGMRAAKQNSNNALKIPEDSLSISQEAIDLFRTKT